MQDHNCNHVDSIVIATCHNNDCTWFVHIYRQQLKRKGREKVSVKSREWVLAKKERRRRQGRQVATSNLIVT